MTDNRNVIGPAPSLAQVPLGEVLPCDYVGAEDELRRLAHEFDGHPAIVGRSAWHWYPERKEPPQSSDRGLYLLLVDTTITLYETRDDWLELTLDISWLAPPELTVNAAVEVACWCPQNHNMHQVRTARWHAVNGHELIEAFAAGTAMLVDVLATGPFDPRAWRAQAGLPDAPEASR